MSDEATTWVCGTCSTRLPATALACTGCDATFPFGVEHGRDGTPAWRRENLRRVMAEEIVHGLSAMRAAREVGSLLPSEYWRGRADGLEVGVLALRAVERAMGEDSDDGR